MIRTRLLVLLGVTVLVCLVGVWGRAGTSASAPAVKWEYKMMLVTGGRQKDIEDALNTTGAAGWELAGILNQATGGAGIGAAGVTNAYLIFKRQQ